MNKKIKGRNKEGKFTSTVELQIQIDQSMVREAVWKLVLQLREEIYAGYHDEEKIKKMFQFITEPNDPIESNIRRMKAYILNVDKEAIILKKNSMNSEQANEKRD